MACRALCCQSPTRIAGISSHVRQCIKPQWLLSGCASRVAVRQNERFAMQGDISGQPANWA
eukprot:398594-Amphidinium_carterae.1